MQILKAEIRRHERNTEREHHLGDHQAENKGSASDCKDATPSGGTRTEYLKNVLLRFLCANLGESSGGALERSSLVPVLATLLALSPPERAALQQVAESGVLRGPIERDGEVLTEGSTWSRLLPSWLAG